MIFKLKDKVLTLALIGSLWVHIGGFLLFKVKMLEAGTSSQFLEVGLLESRWEEPLVSLPGESESEEEIFEPSDRLFLKRSSDSNLNARNQMKIIELPQSRFQNSELIKIDEPQQEKETKNLHKGREGFINHVRQRIEGPVSKRNVLFRKNPDYPAWAQRYGLEFEIRLKFWVLPSGEVNLVVIEDSSGYPEIDAEVVRVMKRWKFNALEEGNIRPQWGMILFKFRLKR